MPLSYDTSKRMIDIIEECGNSLIKLIPELEKELTEGELKVMKREIARVITTMDSSLAAKIASAFPDLSPEAVPIAHDILKK